ncbi:mannonate dehydratase [Bosea sp. (in: a-proteobacteria)]|uniref:mannonate dehydratase n=1 Tax=Bosea sp. (in: a-proteobacteria) TaxID=1871050 RepID=UPI001AC412E3|nr:mannonate dehydratase [Bosea sp. (in: a-proteobacteria)]MBN9444273.1 mannonate dehydratase [Bosea sp. (in: a-proteobacteria)]
MEQCWRWFGPDDVVTLAQARQAGASGIVNSLHQIPYGVVWSVEEIEKRQAIIRGDGSLGLEWKVVESLPIHESVKIGDGDLETVFENYRQSMRNLAACGLEVICYNFMPVLDWTRTELAHKLPGGGTALRFNLHEYVALDHFMLKRKGADEGHSADVMDKAKAWFEKSTQADRDRLLSSVMAGLPGAFDRYDLPGLARILERYAGMTHEKLRENLRRFLDAIIPTAEEVGIRMCIHPDDPPRPLFGLPRICSDEDDIAYILDAVDSPANGLTLCSGSLGANPKNDVPGIARRFADRIWFAHLRNVAKDPDGSFMEAEHLGGDTDMVALVDALMAEEQRRKAAGLTAWQIAMRPDHGHELLDDLGKGSFPGYPAVGRLRGLAELRGVMTALAQVKGYDA